MILFFLILAGLEILAGGIYYLYLEERRYSARLRDARKWYRMITWGRK